MKLRRRSKRAPVLAVELEACNPEGLRELAAGFGVVAREIEDGGRYGWPIYRYEGSRSELVAFLADQYDDGSGETADELLDRLLKGE